MKIIILSAIGILAVAIVGWFIYPAKPGHPATPMETCRAALETSEPFRSLIARMDATNREAAYETASMRCVLDSDPKSAGWSEEKKRAVVVHAFCEKRSGGNVQTEMRCETVMGEMMATAQARLEKYGPEAIFTPENLK